ncbi:MAG: cob(I)yrinic acid a,c-diamide adenosyltransferase [Thermoplasmata archaeon]|nr:cob(I)yrinic acid a,c-diamide adenosyltransferase [Thermoplasmata archaeon]
MATGGPTPTKLYTRTGDHGETGLVGGSRVAKDSERIRAFGSLDELGASLGRASATLGEGHPAVSELLLRLQHELYIAQAELATPSPASAPSPQILERHVARLESDIDRFSATFEPVHTFVLARGKRAGSELHVARTVARRAERDLWALHRLEPQRSELLRWTNRMSDLLFALALSVNRAEGVHEVPPDYSV